jgi:D-alanine transaminase
MSKGSPIVYLQGEYLPVAEAKVSVEDRGFLFADGIYEVIRFYGGQPFGLEPHLRRFEHSAEGTALPLGAVVSQLPGIFEELMKRNGVRDTNVYVQYTRGAVHPRTHTFPAEPHPTLFVMPVAVHVFPDEYYTEGVRAMTRPDIRWRRCDIKSTMLVPNVVAKQQARDGGAYEAILVRDGLVTEGSSTNIFAVFEGVLATHPQNQDILGGITRETVLALAREVGIPVREKAVGVERLYAADEVFLTSTSSEVMPIVEVDGRTIGDGQPGPMSRRLLDVYRKRVVG